MHSFFQQANQTLHSGAPTGENPPKPVELSKLFGLFLAAALLYGAVMGSFSGFWGEHLRQVLFSALKVPLLLAGTFCVCLPSFFVLNTLFGVRADFGEALKALATAQAVLTLVLASLSPFTAVWYLSVANYSAALLFNACIFGLATVGAQLAMRRLYQPLLRNNPKHRVLLRIWQGIYSFVGIELAWVLRPFVGEPTSPVQWFRDDAWGNAYVQVFNHLRNLLP